MRRDHQNRSQSHNSSQNLKFDRSLREDDEQLLFTATEHRAIASVEIAEILQQENKASLKRRVTLWLCSVVLAGGSWIGVGYSVVNSSTQEQDQVEASMDHAITPTPEATEEPPAQQQQNREIWQQLARVKNIPPIRQAIAALLGIEPNPLEEPFQEPLPHYSQHEIDYFLEIALNSEYGSSNGRIKKWTEELRIGIRGNPTEEDKRILFHLVDEINNLAPSLNPLITNAHPQITIHFEPVSKFEAIEPNYKPGNYGFFWGHWDRHGQLKQGTILIASSGISPSERSHLIREELTQALGLMNDSNKYPESIFYQTWTDTTEYAPIDQAVIKLLYDPRITVGMTQQDVLEALIDKYPPTNHEPG